MPGTEPYTITVSTISDNTQLLKNCWIVILHAHRTPPHAGVIINGHYYSLTIKGQELNVKAEVLLKTITQKKIETLAIQLIKQPVFSLDYQEEIMEYHVKQFHKVEAGKTTCLNPVKLFLQEFYVLDYRENELLFEIVERLKQNNYIYTTVGFNLNNVSETEISLPVYTSEKLQELIAKETGHTS